MTDLAPVGQVATFQYALAVAVSHPARDVAEFVAWVKANPAKANFGTPAAGSLPHLLVVLVGRTAAVDLIHVPYRGATQLGTDVVAGEVSAGISALSDFLGLHRAGKVRILATSAPERSPLLPTVPTFSEQGFSSSEALGWHGLYAPAGTPHAMIEKHSAVVMALMRSPELRDRFMSLGLETTGT